MRKRLIQFCPLAAVALGLVLVVAAAPTSGPADFTAKSITAESLTIKAPGSDSSVSILARRDATGIWVNSGQGTEAVGLVVQPGIAPYFVIHDKQGNFPPLAITSDHLQIAKDGKQANP